MWHWEGSVTVEEKVGALLVEQDLSLVTAESCTGGLMAHRITNVSGSSAYYLGGFVAYAYEAKEILLGVEHETLLAHGAVSEETAQEMARGVRQRLGAGVGISITGIAGPTGGMLEKPVGLTYIALSTQDAELCERHVWQGDRLANKEQSVEAAFRLLLTYLQKRRG
jgi:nicotinamide-nucleotide amidase